MCFLDIKPLRFRKIWVRPDFLGPLGYPAMEKTTRVIKILDHRNYWQWQIIYEHGISLRTYATIVAYSLFCINIYLMILTIYCIIIMTIMNFYLCLISTLLRAIYFISSIEVRNRSWLGRYAPVQRPTVPAIGSSNIDNRCTWVPWPVLGPGSRHSTGIGYWPGYLVSQSVR